VFHNLPEEVSAFVLRRKATQGVTLKDYLLVFALLLENLLAL
jgi:hypothetical protein